jgi:hypothetical protein
MIPLMDLGISGSKNMKAIPKLYGKEPLSDPELSALEDITKIAEIPLRDLVVYYAASHSLIIDEKNLESVPDSIGNLVRLETLLLTSNRLSTLPASIGNLVNLKVLRLYDNKITTVPESMCKLRHLKELDLLVNPLINIPAPVKAWILERKKAGCRFSGIEFVQPTTASPAAPAAPKIVVEREAAVAKVRCPYCKYLASPTDSLCPHCGAIL